MSQSQKSHFPGWAIFLLLVILLAGGAAFVWSGYEDTAEQEDVTPEEMVAERDQRVVAQESLKARIELANDCGSRTIQVARKAKEREQSDCKDAMEMVRAGVHNCFDLFPSDMEGLRQCVEDNTYMHTALYTGEDPPEQNVWGERREKLTEEKLVEDMILIRGLVRDCLEREGILGGESSRLDCVNIKTYWLTAPYTGEAIPEIMKGGPF